MSAIDGFRHAASDTPHAAITRLLADCFADTGPWQRTTGREARSLFADLGAAAFAPMLDADADGQRALVLALVERVAALADGGRWRAVAWSAYSSMPSFHWVNVLMLALARLLKKRHVYEEGQLLALIAAARRFHQISTADVVGHVERALAGAAPSQVLRAALEALDERTWKKPLKARIAELLSPELAAERAQADAERSYALEPDEPWSRRACAELAADGAADRWRALFRATAEGADGAQPTQGWRAGASTAIEGIGRARFAELAAS